MRALLTEPIGKFITIAVVRVRLVILIHVHTLSAPFLFYFN
jgi:hypothetical protein